MRYEDMKLDKTSRQSFPVEDSGQISIRTVCLTLAHVFIVLYVGVRDILLGGFHRKETTRD